MRPTRNGVLILFTTIGALWLSVPTSSQGRRGQRFDVQIVNGQEAVAREVLVKFRRSLRPDELARIRTQTDAGPLETIGRAGYRRLRSRSFDTATLVALLLLHAEVDDVEPNFIVHAFTPPNDPRFPELWGLENTGQAVNGGLPGLVGSDIQAVRAWDLTLGSTANVVAVVDTGIDYTHPDLAANMWSAPSAFTVNIENRPITCPPGSHGFNAITLSCDPMDDHNHGTHVAGTIGASGNNGIGVVGVNWTTKLMGLKFLDASGSGSVADAINAIQFAIQAQEAFAATGGANIRVLSNSWGGGAFSQALLDEINAANSRDMLFVAAAGNIGFSNDILPTYPASYAAPNVVAVAATTNTDARAWFSNYGASSVHLGAPGVDILSTTIGNTYGFSSGTSMAAPHVSGAAALVLSRCALDTAGLKDVILGSVKPVPSLASLTITGGRLDVNSAIHACIGPPDTPTSLTAASGDGQVVLAWSAAAGATGYIVKRSLTSGGPYVQIASDISATTYTDAAVVNGTTYFYVVTAVNALGASGDSNEASATPNTPSDLVISSLTVPSAAGAGTTITVSEATRNQGAGAAGPSTTRFYLSRNSVVDSSDTLLNGAHAIPSLLPGDTSSASVSLDIPGEAATGLYFLIAKADADNVLNESQETNNTLGRPLYIGPDLIVSSLTVPAKGSAGGTISVTDTVKNQGGGGAGASTTRFYFSTNTLIDASDVLLGGGRAVPGLAPGASSSGSTPLTIPSATTVGTYYIIAKADVDNTVVETQEGNNTAARVIQIGGDLVVSAFTVPAKGGAGGTIVVTDTTTNQGAGATAASVTKFYLSTNTVLDASDVLLAGNRPVPALAASTSSSGSTTVTIPSATGAGTYYVIAKADADSTVAETQESNNTSVRIIAIGPDLTISSISVAFSIAAGATVTVSETVTNSGAGAAGPSTTRFYLSTNLSLDSNDVLLTNSRAVPALGPGASSPGSTPVTIPASTSSGSYFLLGKADADSAVTESNEANNVGARAVQVTGGP